MARKQRYRQPCVDCGILTNGSDGYRTEPRCHPCAAAHFGPLTQVWTADRIIERIQAWNAIYGEPPAIGDWNPWQARHVYHDEARARRFEAGNWPWNTIVVNRFGTWSAALEAAGFQARAPHGGNGNAHRRRDHHQVAA